MGASKMKARPWLGKMSPISILMVVVFPAPLGPTKPKISPSSTEKERSSTAVTRLPGRSSKTFVSPSVRRIMSHA
jgi:hypothetical protein